MQQCPRQLADWLETLRTEAETELGPIRRPDTRPGEASEAISERQQQVETLRARLLHGIDPAVFHTNPAPTQTLTDGVFQIVGQVPVHASGGGPPLDPMEEARWILAYVLDFHRRDDKAS